MRSVIRIVVAAALVPWLAVSSALAPEHVHESESGDHHVALAHRHLAAHDDGGAEVEAGNGDVLWIHDVGIAQPTCTFPHVLKVLRIRNDVVPRPLDHVVLILDEATLPHGPPRVSSPLRAPPSVSL